MTSSNRQGRRAGALRSAVAAAFAVLVAFAVSDFVPTASADPTLDRIKSEGKIRVGFFNGVPEAYVGEDGKLTGESPTVLAHILKNIGDIEIEAFNVDDFGALIPGLIAGRFDIIATGLYITPARCEQIAFANPTAKYGEALIVKTGNPHNIHSYDDIAASPDAILAVNAGSQQATIAEKSGIPADRVMLMPSATALTAVREDRVQALGIQSISAAATVRAAEGGGIELATPFKDPIIDGKPAVAYAGFGVRKQDADLLKALNDALAVFINSPDHLAAVEPFGFSEADLPGDRTAADICSGG